MAAKHEIELSAITTMCLSLESILKKCFGPNGLSVMLTTATGTLMITGSGAAILRSLQLSHPIGRMVTDSVATHCQHTGDNCKTFVFLLCGMLRKLCGELSVHRQYKYERLTVANALAHLKRSVLPRLVCQSITGQSTTVCCTQDDLHRVKSACNDTFASTLRGRFNKATASHLAKVLVEMTFADVDVAEIPLAIDECIKYFPQVHVEIAGNAIQSTHVVDGIIIQRDIKVHVPSAMENGVRFMLVAFNVTDSQSSSDHDNNVSSAIHVASTDHLRDMFAWKMSHMQGFVQLITSRDVNLLVCSSVVSDVLAFHCRRAGISIIQAVDEDDMRRLEFVFNIHAVYSWSELLSTRVVGQADSCRSVQLGVHRWSLLQPNPATTTGHCSKPLSRQLVVCAPTVGVCDQVASALLGCLKCSRMLFDTSVLCDVSGLNPWPVPCTRKSQTGLDKSTGFCHSHCVFIPGGGTFERTLDKELQLYKQRCNDINLTRGADLLQHGLQSVLSHLARNLFASSDVHPLVAVATATNGKQLDGVIEPLASKVVLLHDLVTLLQQLLRVDMLVPVRHSNDYQSNSDGSL